MKQKVRKIWAYVLVFALLAGICPWQVKTVKAESVKSFFSDNGEVEITLTENLFPDGYWCEYSLAVTNHSSQSIRDWQLTLSVNDISKYSKSFGCQATVKNDKLVVKGQGNGKVAATGSTYKVDGDFKLGFTSQVSFTGAEITYEYGSQSTGGSNEGSVGSGATFIDGYQCNYMLTGQTKEVPYEDTPYGKHGALHVDGLQIKDTNNRPFTLRGASTHGMHWGDGETFLNKTAFQNLRDEWGVNMVRLVSYVTQGGYTEGSKDKLDKHIREGVSDLTDLGMYAIIDWHVHAENPNDKKAEAIQFFDTYSKMYKDQSNIIYEICNEPTGTPWNQIRPYAVDVVNTIRANDPDAIIVVGTNTWSQDVDEVATNGGKIDDPNVMYTIHFYSGTHGESLREKVRTALKAGTPVFCTEFGVCDASGNGGFDLEEADRWIDFFEENGISYCCWSLSKKNESASMISPECSKVNGFTNEDLGGTGAWLINTYRSKSGESPAPSETPSTAPSETPTATTMPTAIPSEAPSQTPTATTMPTVIPSEAPGTSTSPSVSAAPNENGESAAPADDEDLHIAVSGSSYSPTVIDGVQGVELRNFDTQKTTIVIPDYITIKGKKYPVIAISGNAFKKCKKLTKVVIGKNVRRIKPKAFYNCKNLKTIVIKTKKLTMKRVGKKAFAGIYKKAKITLPKGGFSKMQKAAYKKILRARGVGKKAKIK